MEPFLKRLVLRSPDDLLLEGEKGEDKILVFFSDNDPKDRVGVKPIRT